MTELEQALTAVGAGLEWPAAPDLAPGVRVRLERRRLRLRVVAVAFAAVAVGVGAALLVPSARTAILRFLPVGAVRVERGGTPPPARGRPPAARPSSPAARGGGR